VNPRINAITGKPALSYLRIAVFGGRDYADLDAVWIALDKVLAKHPEITLVHGDCPTGADAHADAWAHERGIGVERYPAHWGMGPSAGPKRNRAMARSGLHGAVGFPGGRGTASMTRELEAAGVPVWWPAGR
jgi:hypothetical protein